MDTRRTIRLTLLVLLVFVASFAPAAAEDKLDLAAVVPFDPDIKKRVTLPNGMRYWVRPHKKPRGTVSLVMHVASGSVHEGKGERGFAHFVEHLAFEGSKNFPPGSVVPYFTSLGITFGLHQNAHTSYAYTEYSIHMPRYTQETLERSLLFLSDAARELSFTPEEVEKEKPVIIEEDRYRGGVRSRLAARSAPLIFYGSRYAFRQPIGKMEDIRAATSESVRKFHRTWYRPDRTTLIVVGDIDPEVAGKAIEKTFGDWKKPSAKVPNIRIGKLAPKGLRVGIYDDPDQHYTRVSITHNRDARPLNTYGDMRRELLESLALAMMNARFELMRRWKSALLSYGWMRHRRWVPGLVMTDCGATGQAGRWIPCMRELVHEVRRVRLYGFGRSELDRVRTEILARYDNMAESKSSDLATGYHRDIARRRKPISRAAWERVTRACLPDITTQDVDRAFRAMFDLNNVSIMLSVPQAKEGRALPTEADVREYYQEALEDKLKTWSERNEGEKVDSILEKDPEPGDVATRKVDQDLGVTSLVMKNGVRVNLKKIKTPGKVYVRVNFLGGEIEETEKTLGITHVAFGSLDHDGIATRRVDPDTVARYLGTRQMGLSCNYNPAVIRYDLWATKDDLDDALRLLWLTLTQPYVEAKAFNEARDRANSWVHGIKTEVDTAADHWLDWQLSGEDLRWSAPEWRVYERITHEAAQAWLERIVRTAPMEIAVVGDVDAQAGEALARRWFASLPERPDRLKEVNKLRRTKTWAGPKRRTENVDSNEPGAVVMLAWRGVGRAGVAERTALGHAAGVVDARVHKVIREEHGLSYSVSARSVVYDCADMSHLMVQLTTEPAKTDQAAALVRKVVRELAKEGPTDAELETVERQWRALMKEGEDSPTRWLSALTRLHIDGRGIDGVKERFAAWQNADAPLVKKTLAKVVEDARFCQVIALPKKPGASKKNADPKKK